MRLLKHPIVYPLEAVHQETDTLQLLNVIRALHDLPNAHHASIIILRVAMTVIY